MSANEAASPPPLEGAGPLSEGVISFSGGLLPLRISRAVETNHLVSPDTDPCLTIEWYDLSRVSRRLIRIQVVWLVV